MLRHFIFALVFALPALRSFAGRKLEPDPKSNVRIIQGGESSLPAGSFTGAGKSSESLHSGWVDALVPFASAHGFTLFGNLRGTWDDDSQALFNTGLGFRYLVPGHDVIIGGNIYYDRIDSALGNQYDQLGLGAELLTKWIDARFNYYLPDNSNYLVSVGTGLYRIESGIEGWNTEAGFRVPWVDRFVEARLFGGYYEYRSRFGTRSAGWKARGEIRWTPGIITDVEWWEDKSLNGGNWVAGVRVSLPFEIGNLFQGRNPFAGAGEALRFRKREFKERLGETVMRSHRVQTAQSGLLVDARYLKPVTVSSPSANGTGAATAATAATAAQTTPGTPPNNNGSVGSGTVSPVAATNNTVTANTLVLNTNATLLLGNPNATGTAGTITLSGSAVTTYLNTGVLQITGNTFTNVGTIQTNLGIGTIPMLIQDAGPVFIQGAGTMHINRPLTSLNLNTLTFATMPILGGSFANGHTTSYDSALGRWRIIPQSSSQSTP